VQAVEASVFAGLDPDTPSETVTGIYQRLVTEEPGAVQAYLSPAAFRDIGTAADYLETARRGARRWRAGALIGARTRVGRAPADALRAVGRV
jgi:hypothetical protein